MFTEEEKAASWTEAGRLTPGVRLRRIADRLSCECCSVVYGHDSNFTKVGLIHELRLIADEVNPSTVEKD